jgi:hypothetical protein
MSVIQSRARADPFLLVYVAKAAPPRVAIICTTPNGMLRGIVLNASYPKDLTMRGPKIVIPPLGILDRLSSTAKIEVVGYITI